MAISEYWGVPTHELGRLSKENIEGRKIRDLPSELEDRFTDKERALYEAGLCGEQVEYGNGGIGTWCGAPADDDCTFGHCGEHHERNC